MTEVPSVLLNTGASMPQVGFGVFLVSPGEAPSVVAAALEAGYRSVDTAAAYGNEEAVGTALRKSGLPREELFVTTKLRNADHGYDRALRAFDASLAALGLDYVDLYLIHWPQPARGLYVETWRALERVHAEGRARAIGVSNFLVPHLERLLAECDVVPAVNQIELHPGLQQGELRAFHAEHGILTEAWSPLAKGEVLGEPAIVRAARKHGRTPAQVVLRWHLQLGNVVIPKSVSPERLRENIDLFSFELDEEDLAEIAKLDTGTRIGPHPETFGG